MADITLRLKAALRSLRRSKRFAIGAILVISLGIGSSALVFSVLDAVLLHPADFPDVESMVEIQARGKNKIWEHVSPAVYDALRRRRDLFREVAATRIGLFTVTGVPAPDQVFGLSVSANYFAMLGAKPYFGRLFQQADEQPGAVPVAILSYRGWQQLFAANPHVTGKAAVIDGTLYTIAGVMPASFVPPGDNAAALLWTTLRLSSADLASDARNLQLYARLGSSVSLAGAQSALSAIASSITASLRGREPLELRARKWQRNVNESQRTMVWLAMGVSCGLLLIGCANLSSVLLARGIARRRDYAVSLAVGATRRQLIAQSFLEVAILLGGSLALVLAIGYFVLPVLRDRIALLPTGIPNLARIHLGAGTLLFCFGMASISALLCGCLPALFATAIDVSTGLRESTLKIAGSRSVRRLLHSIVALEVAVSMLLLLSSLLLVRSLTRLLSEDHGMRADHVLTMRLPSGSWHSRARLSDNDEHRLIRNYLSLLARAQATAGVQAAALTSSLPLSNTVVRTHVELPGASARGKEHTIEPVTQCVTSDYFRAMGTPILAGRSFSSADAASKVHVALVNQTFVREYLGGADPIGQLLRDPENHNTIQIIGVVKDAPHLDLGERIDPEIYFDFEQQTFTPFLTGLVARTWQNPQMIAKALRQSLALASADQAVVHIATMQNLIRENTWQPRFSAWLFSSFACLALCLSAVGIYGVVSYVTAARRRDYGIRLSLGTAPGALFRLVTMESLRPVLIGIASGTLGSYWISRWIGSLLYKTGTFDPWSIAIATAIFLIVTLIATCAPALRAARTDPAIALREE
jgi:putative ABC transport system permease protein